MKHFFLIVLSAAVLMGAGCSTAEESFDTATNAVNSAEEATANLEDAMEKEEAMIDEAEDGDHTHAGDEDAMHMMDEEDASTDAGKLGEEEMMSMIELEDLDYDYSGELEDVTADGTGTGTAQARYTDGTYSLYVSMEDVPELEDGYFYEGWVVRPEPFAFISTGEVTQKDDGTWVNAYESTTDYTDHVNYVLTLEPDDGDPAPAEHILEGTMTAQ